MCRLHSFCCCCRLRTGAGCAVAFNIYGIVDTAVFYWEDVFDSTDLEYYIHKCIHALVFALVLCYAIWKNNLELILAYCFYCMTVIISDLLYLIFSYVERDGKPDHILCLRTIYFVIECYFYWIIISYYLELKESLENLPANASRTQQPTQREPTRAAGGETETT